MKRILMYSDCPYAPTGFGQVSENIIKALQDEYLITLVAINHKENKQELKVKIINDQQDNFSIDLFKRMLTRGGYDHVLIAYNPEMATVFWEELKEAKKVANYIHYAPIDTCHRTHYQEAFKEKAGIRIYYNEFARKLLNDHEGRVINHGIDIETYKPESQMLSRARLGVKGEFVFLNVNHNQWRKDLFRTILAFAEFSKNHNSKLILHSNRFDMGGDLHEQIDNAERITGQDLRKLVTVTNPNKWEFGREQLAELYNSCDAFITTSLGEGWGMTTFEAMACGKPIIAPNISIFKEKLSHNYLYEAKDWVMPYRETNTPYPLGRTEDIIKQMKRVYQNKDKKVGEKNRKIAEGLSWEGIREQWKNLFKIL